MNVKRPLFLALMSVPMAFVMMAQGLYDDIYYDPKKDTGKKTEQKARPSGGDTYVNVYPAADTYIVTNGSSTRSVDEYNRRGIFAIPDSTAAVTDSVPAEDFQYTRRIEQFDNPNIVIGSGDQALMDLYYSDPVDVNIIVNTPAYAGWYSPWYSAWYDPWFSWNYPYYWGASYWGPSWSWGWGYPGYGWGWGYPSYGWGWGWTSPSWGWGWNGPSRPSWRHPGAVSRPGGDIRPGHTVGNQFRPGTVSRHPGNGVRPNGTVAPSHSTSRPGQGTYRPGGNQFRPGSGQRPSARPTQTTRPNYQSSPRPSSTPSYNPGGSRHNGGSYSRPSGGGGGSRSGGGSYGGGGGGGRGGRH